MRADRARGLLQPADAAHAAVGEVILEALADELGRVEVVLHEQQPRGRPRGQRNFGLVDVFITDRLVEEKDAPPRSSSADAGGS